MQNSPPPGAIGLDAASLFMMIGELYAENWMRKKREMNGIQSLSNGTDRMGQDEHPSAPSSPMFSPNM